MLKIIFEFVGGPHDGRTFHGKLGDASDAERFYLFTNHGTVGQRFKVASEYAVDALAQDSLQEETRHHFQQHYYVVADRLTEDNEVLVRAVYIERETERDPSKLIREHLEPVSNQSGSFEERVQGLLQRTAESVAETHSHVWPAGIQDTHSAARRVLSLHLAHVLLGEKFSVFTQVSHSEPETAEVNLLGIAPSQDWFLAAEFGYLDQGDQLNDLLLPWVRCLQSFWLHAGMTIDACREHMERLAEHCHTGLGVVACLHVVPFDRETTELLENWSSRVGLPAQGIPGELADLNARWHEPIRVQQFAGLGTYYLLGVSFQIPH